MLYLPLDFSLLLRYLLGVARGAPFSWDLFLGGAVGMSSSDVDMFSVVPTVFKLPKFIYLIKSHDHFFVNVL